MTDIQRLLNTTSAGQLAKQLDAADGKVDGKISASIWNDFVKGKGGKEIKNFIDTGNAMKSITTYGVRNSKTLGKGIEDLMKMWGAGIANTAASSNNNTEVSSNAQTPSNVSSSLSSQTTGNLPESVDNSTPVNSAPQADTLDISLEEALKNDLNPPKQEILPVKDFNPPRNITKEAVSSLEKYTNPFNIVEYLKFEYNAAGNKTMIANYDTSGEVLGYKKLAYDDAGNIIKNIRYSADGIILSYSKSEYDNNGNETKYTYYNQDGSVKRYVKFEYDINGNQIKAVSYNPDGSVGSYVATKYDEKGNKISSREIHHTPDGNIYDSGIEYFDHK